MSFLTSIIADPEAWLALIALIAMEIVLGVDNLVFVAILSSKLPPGQAAKARHIGIGLSLIFRVMLLGGAAYIIHLTKPLITVMGIDFSWRDLILIAGGLFLVFKATSEIHHTVSDEEEDRTAHSRPSTFGTTVVQIVLLDLVFSIDSIITAVGMTDHLPVMIVAVIVTVVLMLVAAGPLAIFINRNPTIVMLALGFLLLIGTTLIAEGFGIHFPKGYIYTAMAFSGVVEGLNMFARRQRGLSPRPDRQPPAAQLPAVKRQAPQKQPKTKKQRSRWPA